MATLKPREEEALLLVGAEGLAPSQAAAALGITGAAFRMRLLSARRALTRALNAPYAPDPPDECDAPSAGDARPDPLLMNPADLSKVTQ